MGHDAYSGYVHACATADADGNCHCYTEAIAYTAYGYTEYVKGRAVYVSGGNVHTIPVLRAELAATIRCVRPPLVGSARAGG